MCFSHQLSCRIVCDSHIQLTHNFRNFIVCTLTKTTSNPMSAFTWHNIFITLHCTFVNTVKPLYGSLGSSIIFIDNHSFTLYTEGERKACDRCKYKSSMCVCECVCMYRGLYVVDLCAYNVHVHTCFLASP